MEKKLVMRPIWNKIYLHPCFYITMIIMLITGLFKVFLLFLFIIITHELGHLLAITIFKWQIKKIILLPFGALILIEDDINKPLIEELIITIMGPLFQIITLFCFPFLDYISIPLLLFNLLPIYPLDGSKLLNIFLNKLLPFKHSYLLSLLISFIITILVIIYNHNFIIFICLFFLFYKTYDAYTNVDFYFNRFLLERYLKKINFSKTKLIKGIKPTHMYRDKKHTFLCKNRFYSESEILAKLFDFKREIC